MLTRLSVPTGPAPGRTLGPGPGQVHVWAVLEPELRDEAVHRRCRNLLSPAELARWEAMPPTGQMLYASAHAALRGVTAAYTGQWPAQVRFLRGIHGKPYVAGRPGLRVSLSHTRGMSLVAVSTDGPTGVDVERVRALGDSELLPELVFSDWERPRFEAVPARSRAKVLYSYWTCKEAVLKALGTGLTGDLRAVEVDPGEVPGGPVPLRSVPAHPASNRRWGLHLLNLGPHYRAAVAVAGGAVEVRSFTLPAGAVPRRPDLPV